MKNLILLIITISSAFAAEQVKVDVKDFTETVVKESEMNRENKTWGFSYGVGGNYSSTSTNSFDASYFINRNTIVSAGYVRVGKKGSSRASTWYEANVFNLSLKRFTNNSFYVQGDIYHREASERRFAFSINSTYTNNRYKDIGAGIRIGNQWQWENFTLGCDWVGFNRTISKLSTGTGMTRFRDGSATLLHFYLGANF